MQKRLAANSAFCGAPPIKNAALVECRGTLPENSEKFLDACCSVRAFHRDQIFPGVCCDAFSPVGLVCPLIWVSTYCDDVVLSIPTLTVADSFRA